MDSLLTYESIRTLSYYEDDDLIDINFKTEYFDFLYTKEFQKFCLVFIAFILFFPTEKCFAAVLEKTNELNIDSNSFFEEGDRVIKKLYQEYDYRPTKNNRSFKNINKIGQKIIDTTLVSSKNISTSNTKSLELDLLLPIIDLNKLFIQKTTPLITEQVTNQNVINIFRTNLQSITSKEKIFFIRGGFLGFIAGQLGGKVATKLKEKVFGKIGKKFEDWVGNDEENSYQQSMAPINQFAAFFKNNPVVAFLFFALLYKNKDKIGQKTEETIRGGLPPVIANVIVGQKQTPKTIFYKIISPKNPYIYIIFVTFLFVVYRQSFFKLFKREITPSEVISEITKSFLKTNSELFNKFYDLTRDFTQNTVKTEERSFEAGQKANKEKYELFEKNLNECKSERFTINEELKAKNDVLNNCQNTYNILNTHTESFIHEISREEAFKNLEYEVRKNLNQNDDKFLLTGPQLVEKEDYKKRFDEIFKEVKDKNIKILEEKLIPKTFEQKKN